MFSRRLTFLGESRDLLYVATSPPLQLLDGLISAGWNPIMAYGPGQVQELCRCRDVSVGVVELGEQQDECDHLLLSLIAASNRDLQWIALTPCNQLDRPEVRSALLRSCYDFATVPVPVDRLVVTLGRAYGMMQLRRTLADAQGASHTRYGIIGVSAAIEAVRRSVETFATSDAPVLIIGETGTGKELTASAIHVLSGRRHGPLVTVNSGALPDSLIQSELFGYERGAFTGAERRTIGKLEAANGGTIFLDEIGDLPPQLQVNLLRFLQEHRIQRVGGHAEIELDLRVVAATNVDLEQAVRDRRFREDLYYRLNVLLLRLPPLRDRMEDIELLAQHVFQNHTHECRRDIRGFSQNALTAMCSHAWPGNVRELINRVRRALITCEGSLIRATDLGLNRRLPAPVETLSDARCKAEREVVQRTVLMTRGNLSEAARRLNVTRTTLYRLIRKYGVGPVRDIGDADDILGSADQSYMQQVS